MKKSYFVVAIVVAVIAAIYAAWNIAYPSGTWRYKMTVTVETPEGFKTGSAVREVHVQRGLSLTPEMTPHVELKGEAVVVDLGERGVLFALVGGDSGYRVVFNAFPFSGGGTTKAGLHHYSELKNVKAVLAPADYPRFVRFRDINDPKTVENLLELESEGKHPSTFTIKKDRFAEAFGAGVKLQSVTIEMTDEPVTRGIVGKYMPSYSPQEEYLKWLRTLPYGDPRAINANDFGSIRGAK